MKLLVFSSLAIVLASCSSTSVVREKTGALTFARGGWNASPTSYWIQGAQPGQVTSAENLTVFRRYRMKSLPAAPVECVGWIDSRRPEKIEVQLAERRGTAVEPAWMNGRCKVTDENAPKPFYHRLIP